MISESELQDFDQRLRKRRQEILLLKEGKKGDSAPKQLDQTRVGRLSRMDAMQQQAMSRAADNLLNVELQRIKTALERIEAEEYGYCILCEEEIAVKRLQFDPSLLTCIDCAQAAER